MNILIVDDSKLIQDRIKSILHDSKSKKNITQAFNVIEAKEILLNENFDLVISDIRMPGGGGLELLEFIKKRKNEIPVIIITNYPYPQYRERAVELGAEYFLSKIEDLEKIDGIINEISRSNKKDEKLWAKAQKES